MKINCAELGHAFPDKPDRVSISEEYYECMRIDCDYVDRRPK